MIFRVDPEHRYMEIILLALVLSILLALAPVRTRSSPTLQRPAAIRQHVDIDRIRQAMPIRRYGAPGTHYSSPEKSRLTSRPRTVPILEEDNVERLTYKGKRMVVIARDSLLLLRTCDD